MTLRDALVRMKSGSEPLNYGREIVLNWASEYILKNPDHLMTILDLGLGVGTDLLAVKHAVGHRGKFLGIESYPPNVISAKKNGIEVSLLNIESAVLPYESQTVDIVIANQLLEHTKELFWIFSEVIRVLKSGGIFIIGVPNLASFHNRIGLLFGVHPSSIKTLGPHVRGFTKQSMQEFAEVNGYLKLINYKGSNFYPFPLNTAKKLAEWFPGLAVSNFFSFERTTKVGSFLEVLDQEFIETPYYRGINSIMHKNS